MYGFMAVDWMKQVLHYVFMCEFKFEIFVYLNLNINIYLNSNMKLLSYNLPYSSNL